MVEKVARNFKIYFFLVNIFINIALFAIFIVVSEFNKHLNTIALTSNEELHFFFQWNNYFECANT